MTLASPLPLSCCGDMKLAEKVMMLLERSGMSQAALARACGISPNRISELKDGKYHPPLGVALLIARTLGVSLDFLADPNQEEPPAALTREELAVIEIVRQIGPRVALSLLTEPLRQHGLGPEVLATPAPSAHEKRKRG